jgi:hypothetical protein
MLGSVALSERRLAGASPKLDSWSGKSEVPSNQ